MAGNAPIDKIERFPVEAAFFENQGENGIWVNTTISKVYEKGGDWHRTNILSGNDLLKLNAIMPDILARQHELEHGQPKEPSVNLHNEPILDDLRDRAEHRREKSQAQDMDLGIGY